MPSCPLVVVEDEDDDAVLVAVEVESSALWHEDTADVTAEPWLDWDESSLAPDSVSVPVSESDFDVVDESVSFLSVADCEMPATTAVCVVCPPGCATTTTAAVPPAASAITARPVAAFVLSASGSPERIAMRRDPIFPLER
jgi:hypothetical protein